MESNKNLFWNKAMFWGFIIALAVMLATSAYYATDSMMANSKSLVEITLIAIGIILCNIAYSTSIGENDQFEYSRALGLGVATAFFSSLTLALFTFVLFKFIDPDLVNQLLIETEEKFIEAGLDDDLIEQQIAFQGKFITPGIMAVSTIFSSVFWGLIISSITSIFLRKKSIGGFEGAMKEINNED
jgi:hypothetical protein